MRESSTVAPRLILTVICWEIREQIKTIYEFTEELANLAQIVGHRLNTLKSTAAERTTVAIANQPTN